MRQPWPLPRTMDLGIADHGECACREQAAQIAIALLADTAKLVIASARVLLRHEPNPGREVPPRSESLGIGNAATSAVASAGPTPGIASSRLLVAFDRCQAMMRRSNSRIQCPQFTAESSKTRAALEAGALVQQMASRQPRSRAEQARSRRAQIRSSNFGKAAASDDWPERLRLEIDKRINEIAGLWWSLGAYASNRCDWSVRRA